MGAPKPFNGHHCWNCWNVALWITNDEGMYRHALECIKKAKSKSGVGWVKRASHSFMRGIDGRTPDGAKYTLKAVMNCLKDLDE